MANWIKNPRNLMSENWVLNSDNGWYCSYNPNPPIGSQGPETALVSNGTYFILLGDHREQFKLAIEKDGFGSCLRYFNEHRDQEGFWSEAPSEKKNG